MKAISIRQPWAWAILHAGKRIENRRWRPTWRGPVLIHAASAWGAKEWADREFLARTMGLPVPERPDLGGVVGRARIVMSVGPANCPPGQREWFAGPYGWLLDDVEALPFRPCRGKLGIFDLPDEFGERADHD